MSSRTAPTTSSVRCVTSASQPKAIRRRLPAAMCRVLGCVAREPVSLRDELTEAQNPLIRQAEEHDSGWGMSVYRAAEGEEPRCVRFAHAAHQNGDFSAATEARGRI